MIMPEKLSLSDFVTRRLHPVKVTIGLLNHEMDLHTEKGETTINSDLLSSVANTLSLFVEDYEKLIGASASAKGTAAVDRKFVGEEAKKL